MDVISKLQYINLVQKVMMELENNIGLKDQAVAEWIIDVAYTSQGKQEFSKRLKEGGGSFSKDFTTSLFNLISKMNPENLVKILLAKNEQMKDAPNEGVNLRQYDERIRQKDVDGLSRQKKGFAEDEVRDANGFRSTGGDDERHNANSISTGKNYTKEFRKDHRADRDIAEGNLVVNQIYKGRVTSIKDFGIFVAIESGNSTSEGLVHISKIRNEKVNPYILFKVGCTVYVRIIVLFKDRMYLSMLDIDQNDGTDILKGLDMYDLSDYKDEFSNIRKSNYNRRFSSSKVNQSADISASSHRSRHRISSPDRFELAQLSRVGVFSNGGSMASDLRVDDLEDDMEEDIDANIDQEVELNEEQPLFLKGREMVVSSSMHQISKTPVGSMAWAALTQSALAKERRENREKMNLLKNQEMDSKALPSFLDPMNTGVEGPMEVFSKQGSDIPDWKKAVFGQGLKLGKTSVLSIEDQRKALPVYAFRETLLEAIKNNPILIIVGETGSGKTTQLTQYLAEAGYGSKGRIACTQPRRVAAVSVAKRVAEEVGCVVGELVGYSIRFEDVTSPQTVIKYMTDGMLLRECLVDPDLKTYSAIIIDEAHERSIHTDVLMGLLKQAIKRRDDLKLIVTSATLNASKFSSYFYDASILTIPGRTYEVEVLFRKKPVSDYIETLIIMVFDIHINEPPGDILIFLTGQEEIDTTCELLHDKIVKLGPNLPKLNIYPIYSALPSEMQSKIFEPTPVGERKVVIATNIAETSLTIDGIYYVIDPGFVKQKVYNPKTGMDALVICPISKAQAEQRAGRAGRTGPGRCFRLYTKSAYENEMLDSPIPEIQRTNLANTVLTMKALGINDLFSFDFMDKPAEAQLVAAMHTLWTLGALEDEGLLTRVGRKMAEFPLEPQLAKILLTSVSLGCSDEILSIVAMLSVQNVFYRPKEKAQLADQKRSKFFQPEGDHLTLLNVFQSWKQNKYSSPWCYENFIQARSMAKALDVRKQLVSLMDRYKLDVISCGTKYDQVRKAIVSGFFAHAAKKDLQGEYRTVVEGTPVYLHPSSSLFNRPSDWVIYHELVQTSREYMREVLAIEPKWLQMFAPNFFKLSDPNKISKTKRKERLEPLYLSYRDPNEWRLSKRKG